MRILIVRLSSIGDIVHTLPAVAAIRKYLPDADISWVVEERFAEIVRDCPVVDRLIEIDTRSMRGGKVIDDILIDMSKQARLIRRQKYDIAIDPQGLMKSAVIAKVSGAKRRWGYSRAELREPASRLLLTNTVKVPERTHVVRKALNLVAGALDLEISDTDEMLFPIVTGDEHRAEAAEIAAATGGRFALLNPGGGWVTKLWHAEKFGQLADMLWNVHGIASVIATGPGESEIVERAVSASSVAKVVRSEPTLKGLYELSKLASVYVGGDTGPTHIASAAGAPVVGLYGPTEWWRTGSLDPDDICVERNDIPCRIDCWRRTCSKWICMDTEADVVFSAVDERLSRAAAQNGEAAYI